MKTARVIITFDCKRNCDGCCNKYTTLMNKAIWIDNFNTLMEYDEVCITGGEPMLDCERTYNIISRLSCAGFSGRIYLYTALFNPQIARLFKWLDGIHYTLHYPANRKDFAGLKKFQRLLRKYHKNPHKISCRLYIDPRVQKSIAIIYHLWSDIRHNYWIPEGKCPLPEHETLYIYQ